MNRPQLLGRVDWVCAVLAGSVTGMMVWAAILVPDWRLLPPAAAMLAAGAVLLLFTIFRKLQRQAYWDFRQMEALIALDGVLRFARPLPPMREWAIGPDFALLVVSLLKERKPRLVLECGSGASTLIVADILKTTGIGRLISIDHDSTYAKRTVAALCTRDLNDVAEVLVAPLKRVQMGPEVWPWYDLAVLPEIPPVDLLIVDGPPANHEPLARYPALPALVERLAEQGCLVLDDAGRTGEQRIVHSWVRAYSGLTAEYVPTEKGAVVIRWSDLKRKPGT